MKRKSLFAASLLLLSLVGPLLGQVCPPGGCPCPPAIQQSGLQETSVLEWYRKLTYAQGVPQSETTTKEAESYRYRAVRITTGNSCGSGSLVGRNADSIFILTNAHVATNRPGNVVNCEAALKDLSGTEKFRATVIEGAYSSSQTTDWALLKAGADHMRGLEPIKLSIKRTDHSKLSFTWGCPRCEVPSGQVLKTVVGDGAVWKWLPNSIGGQSGSGVFQRGYQFGLLTWSYGGQGGNVGAGQYTASIYEQSRNQTNDSEARPPGLLIPTAQDPQTDLIEGYAHAEGEARICSVGNFQGADESKNCIEAFVRQAGVGDYPIWADPDKPTDPPIDPPTDPVDPPKECPPISAESRAKLESAKKLIDEVLATPPPKK